VILDRHQLISSRGDYGRSKFQFCQKVIETNGLSPKFCICCLKEKNEQSPLLLSTMPLWVFTLSTAIVRSNRALLSLLSFFQSVPIGCLSCSEIPTDSLIAPLSVLSTAQLHLRLTLTSSVSVTTVATSQDLWDETKKN